MAKMLLQIRLTENDRTRLENLASQRAKAAKLPRISLAAVALSILRETLYAGDPPVDGNGSPTEPKAIC